MKRARIDKPMKVRVVWAKPGREADAAWAAALRHLMCATEPEVSKGK